GSGSPGRCSLSTSTPWPVCDGAERKPSRLADPPALGRVPPPCLACRTPTQRKETDLSASLLAFLAGPQPWAGTPGLNPGEVVKHYWRPYQRASLVSEFTRDEGWSGPVARSEGRLVRQFPSPIDG